MLQLIDESNPVKEHEVNRGRLMIRTFDVESSRELLIN